jgi:hypothetical protein
MGAAFIEKLEATLMDARKLNHAAEKNRTD